MIQQKAIQEKQVILTVNKYLPGDCISMYQYILHRVQKNRWSSKSNNIVVTQNSREVYVDNKYHEDRILVYQPPPLHKVWLGEEERQESKTRLHWHCDQNIGREKDVKSRVLHPNCTHTPKPNFWRVGMDISHTPDTYQ